MKIVALVHCYLPLNRGGAELMMHHLLSELAARGHEVTVAVTEGGPRGTSLRLDGVKVAYTSAGSALRQNPDRVVSHLKESTRALAWCRQHRKKSIILVHSDHRWILMDLSQEPDAVIFNTHWVRDSVNRRLDLSNRSVVMHPPVDTEKFRVTPGELVTLVNPLPEKGADIFYRAAQQLPEVGFLVVEGGYERPRQVIRTDLDNVTFQEHTDDMTRDVYSRTRVLMMPSSFESYGMTAVEAAASGIPVVATPTPGLKESLGPHGIFLELDEPDTWVETVAELTGDEEAWRRASQQISRAQGRVNLAEELDVAVDAVVQGKVLS